MTPLHLTFSERGKLLLHFHLKGKGGGAVRQRQEKGDAVADQMVEEFVSRVMTALDLPAGESQQTKIITRNSFYLVMRRKN